MLDPIPFTATDDVRDALAGLGQTEDIKFSPDQRRLAIAGFQRNRILLLDVELRGVSGSLHVHLPACRALVAPSLQLPHGVSFLDDQTLAVANRGGDVVLYSLAAAPGADEEVTLDVLRTLPAGPEHAVATPGSVHLRPLGLDLYELLVCNNYANTVTRHVVDCAGEYRVVASAVLLRRDLEVPDGVTVDPTGRWLAVSNHNNHALYLYENRDRLDCTAAPDGQARGAVFPHAARFTPDGRYLFLADAGSPYVWVYGQGEHGWSGAQQPLHRLRVMTDETFERGKFGRGKDSGTKGVDCDRDQRVLVTTSELQPLLFFDLGRVLGELDRSRREPTGAAASAGEAAGAPAADEREKLLAEWARMDRLSRRDLNAQLDHLYRSDSWRMTTPLRWLGQRLRKLKLRA